MEDNNAPVREDTNADDSAQIDNSQEDTQVEQTVEQEQTVEPSQTQDTQPAPAEQQPSADYGYDITQFMPPQQQQPAFTPDEDGFIDPNAFYNKVLADAEARIEQKIKFQESERRAWQNIENKYPEIKEDSDLRDMVNAQRLADVARGGKGDLDSIAGRLLGKLNTYKGVGKAQAQVSEKVQKSATLQKTTANNVAPSQSDMRERLASGNQDAQASLIQQWLDEGKL